ncbi:hypothetical protein SASPL_137397 [Salvia splendens]|uniref:Bulb-type lectin domain-containing protein n=1 Tax=Salvia splendens TaxID=180675 RepID=A0A8X8ZCW9_SALSN|nr:hypothetical protein SASPL_137397 [Salvia splendens]
MMESSPQILRHHQEHHGSAAGTADSIPGKDTGDGYRALASLFRHSGPDSPLYGLPGKLDGETLVSANGVFELGFFNLNNSTNRYVGIWYSQISVPTYVWVANRESPLTDRSGVLTVTAPGVLAILNRTNGTVWSSAFFTTPAPNPIARLLDSGNLIVKDADDDGFTWQSFDYPCDTLLSGIRLGWNYVTGVETYRSSWKSDDDPVKGECVKETKVVMELELGAVSQGIRISLMHGDKQWQMMYHGNDSRPRFECAGWKKFVNDNNLAEGDACIFEVMESSPQIHKTRHQLTNLINRVEKSRKHKQATVQTLICKA